MSPAGGRAGRRPQTEAEEVKSMREDRRDEDMRARKRELKEHL